MSTATQHAWTRWMRWFSRRRRAARHSHDFADYGTAFGLDMSLAAQPTALTPPETGKASTADGIAPRR